MVLHAALRRLWQRRQKGANERTRGTVSETQAEGAQEREKVTAEARAFPGHDPEVGRML